MSKIMSKSKKTTATAALKRFLAGCNHDDLQLVGLAMDTVASVNIRNRRDVGSALLGEVAYRLPWMMWQATAIVRGIEGVA